jgi:glucose/arabinose dehydrogenase
MIAGFPEQDYHTAKSFTFDDKGNIYVNIAAPSNACQQQPRTPGSPGMEPCPQLERQAGIWRFDATQPGQTQRDDGYRYATGIRNAIAMDWNSSVDNLYIVQHGRDQLHELWPDFYDQEDNAELPAEEFFLVTDGMNAGWPYTYYDGLDNVRVVAPEYGGNGEEQPEGEEYRDPILAFPAHWAPNGLIFYSSDQFPEKYRNGAFIAFHGSWNRSPLPQQGYNVVYVPFNGEMPSGDYEVFADGFKGTETLESSNNAEARPMGLAIGPDGSLYISDSMRGKIWRIVYTGR